MNRSDGVVMSKRYLQYSISSVQYLTTEIEFSIEIPADELDNLSPVLLSWPLLNRDNYINCGKHRTGCWVLEWQLVMRKVKREENRKIKKERGLRKVIENNIVLRCTQKTIFLRVIWKHDWIKQLYHVLSSKSTFIVLVR